MTEVEPEEKKNLNTGGEEEDDEYEEEFLGEADEEDEDEAEDEEEEEDELGEDVKPLKKRRCQKRRKIHKFSFHLDDDGEGEDSELVEGEEIEEKIEGIVADEESDVVSFTSSVLSAISFVWEDTVYEFEELCDPGNIETIYRKIYVQPHVLDDVGVYRYLEVCKSLNITPMVRILESLSGWEIDLSFRNVHSKSIRAMCAALETNNIVRRLIMKYNKLKVEDCYYIGLILQYNQTLSYLDFTGCRVGSEGLELLIAHMPDNEYVTELNLSKCQIGDEGMKLLSFVLTRNNSIQKLDLSYNKLGEQAAEALAVALKLNSCITHLILRYNNLFEPATMKGFFRSLTFNNSISHLDLSWNGLSGVEMGGYIKNYIRRSGSIQYLDLSNNRFAGPGALEIKKGLAKSRSLETFKLGKNPLSPEDLDSLLNGAIGSYKLAVFDFDDLWVKKSFLKILKKIQLQREIEVNFAGVLGNYEVFGPDYPKVILQRAQFEAQKPKKQKMRRDFGHLMWILGDEPVTQDEFMKQVKKFKAKVNKELFPELMKQFTIPKVQLIDVVAMREKYLSIFPDSTPPPPPKPKKGAKIEEKKETAPEEKVEEKPEVSVSEAKDKKTKEAEAVKEGFDVGADLEAEEEDDEEEYIIGEDEEDEWEFYEDEEDECEEDEEDEEEEEDEDADNLGDT